MSAGDMLLVRPWALFAVVIAAAVLGYALRTLNETPPRKPRRAPGHFSWLIPADWAPVPVKFLDLPYFIRRRSEDKKIARLLVARDTFTPIAPSPSSARSGAPRGVELTHSTPREAPGTAPARAAVPTPSFHHADPVASDAASAGPGRL